MIELIDNSNLTSFLSICRLDPIGTEIEADFRLYKKRPELGGVMFWVQDNKLALSLHGSLMRITGEISDTNELLSFIEFVSPEFILTSESIAENLPFTVAEEGELLIKKASGIKSEIQPDYLFSPSEAAEFFLKEDMIKDEYGFMSEFALANAQGGAVFKAVTHHGEIVSAAFSGKITENSAVINIVATKSEHRREGLGKKVLKETEKSLSGRDLYIFKEKDKNNEFYSSMGYKPCGLWKTLKIQESD